MTAVDAQFGMGRILRPIPNFEQIYQGETGATPVLFPGAVDVLAGTPGYNPNLGAAVPVPFGARCFLKIPRARAVNGDDVTGETYRYGIRFRDREQTIYSATGDRPFHLARMIGVPDTSSSTPEQRVFVPGTSMTAFGALTANGDNFTQAAGGLDFDVAPFTLGEAQPFLGPGRLAVMQQGVWDPAGGAPQEQAAQSPAYVVIEFRAPGDEVYVLASRLNGNWDFGADDLPFSGTYGTANGTRKAPEAVGIELFVGTSP